MQHSAGTIGRNRFLETGAIVLGSGLLIALPLLILQLQAPSCSGTTPAGQPVLPCAINWMPIFSAFLVAVLSGIVNALTAFIGALHQNQNAPQDVTVTTPENPVPTPAVITPTPPIADKPAEPVAVVQQAPVTPTQPPIGGTPA